MTSSRCSAAASSGACSGSRASRSACSSASSTRSPDAPASAVGDLVVGGARRRDARSAEVARRRDRRHLRVGGRARRRARAASPRDVPGAPGRARRSRSRRTGSSRRRRSARLGIGDRARSPRSTTARGLDAAVDAVGAARGAEDPARRLRRQGPGRARARRPTSTRAWDELGGVPLHPRGVRAVRPRAVDRRGARRRRRRSRAGRWSRTTTRDGILRVTPAPAPRGSTPRCRRAAEALRPAAARRPRLRRRACVELFDVGGELLANEIAPRVHNSGHWTIEGAETSQFENHLRAVLGLAARLDRAARPERDGQLHRRDARPRRGARGPGRAPARLRQGAAPRPQARPRHGRPRPTSDELATRDSTRLARQLISADGVTAPDVAQLASISSAAKPQSASASSVCWPGHGAGPLDLGRRAREARRRRRLRRRRRARRTCRARLDVRVLRRLGHREHRREAHVGALAGSRTTRRASSS